MIAKLNIFLLAPALGVLASLVSRGAVDESQPQLKPTVSEEACPLVVMEAVPGRMEDGAFKLLLQRIRSDAPEARVIAGLPAEPNAASGWTRNHLAALGWRVREDVRIAGRGRLMGPGGREVAPGMYPLRLVRLSPADVR